METNVAVTNALVSMVRSSTRISLASRGAGKAYKKILEGVSVLYVELTRPSMPLLRGTAKVMEGFAEISESCTGGLHLIADTIPKMIEVVKKAQDDRGALTFEIVSEATASEAMEAALRDQMDAIGPRYAKEAPPKNTRVETTTSDEIS